jgi:chromate transporter
MIAEQKQTLHTVEARSNPAPHGIRFREAVKVWARVALLSFGGPAGQIAVMHRILVEEKRWISESRFLYALNYCMLLPGPEAQQLATYIGWLMHRTLGGLMAGALFILPGFVSILTLSVLYAGFQETSLVQAIFYGLKPAVMAVVIYAVTRISRRALKNDVMVAIAVLAFIGIFFLNIPFPLIVLTAGIIGFVGEKVRPDKFLVLEGHKAASTIAEDEALINDSNIPSIAPTIQRTVTVLSIGLLLWFGPLLVVGAIAGTSSAFVTVGVFFSRAAVVTFGGAYAVLAYLAQQAVHVHGWLLPGEMLDGLGMAETTPGPLIQVVQFVGFMGAYRNPGGLDPMVAGVIGSILTTWVTFVPCFLWIFLGAPYIEYLRGNKAITAALSSITASIVGVILNLAIWFSLNTIFAQIDETFVLGRIRLYVPAWGTVDYAAVVIAVGAFIGLFRYKLGMLTTLAVSAFVGLVYYLIFVA